MCLLRRCHSAPTRRYHVSLDLSAGADLSESSGLWSEDGRGARRGEEKLPVHMVSSPSWRELGKAWLDGGSRSEQKDVHWYLGELQREG